MLLYGGIDGEPFCADGLREPAFSTAYSLPLWERWPSAARSDEVVPLRPSASAGYAAAFPWS